MAPALPDLGATLPAAQGGGGGFLDDIFVDLNASTSYRRPKPKERERLPHIDDLLPVGGGWREPPTRGDLKKMASATGSGSAPRLPFVTAGKKNGQELSKPGFMRGESLELWDREKIGLAKRNFEKFRNDDRAKYRQAGTREPGAYHRDCVAWKQPDRSMLGKAQQPLLDAHLSRRKKWLYPEDTMLDREISRMPEGAKESGLEHVERSACAKIISDTMGKENPDHARHLRPFAAQDRVTRLLDISHNWKFYDETRKVTETLGETKKAKRELAKTARRTGAAKPLGMPISQKAEAGLAMNMNMTTSVIW